MTTRLPFPVGATVYLRGYASGEQGVVLKVERRGIVVGWSGTDFVLKHVPEDLVLVDRYGGQERASTRQAKLRQQIQLQKTSVRQKQPNA